MMGRFSQFMARLEDIYGLHDYATFAQSYQTAVLGARLVGFAIPSRMQAKRLLNRSIRQWLDAQGQKCLHQEVAQ